MQAQFPQLLTALDFFHVPENLWPIALKTLSSVRASYAEATATTQRLLHEVLQDGTANASLTDTNVIRKGPYALCSSDDGLLTLPLKPDIHYHLECLESVLEAALTSVAATHGLKLSWYSEDCGQASFVQFHIFVVAEL